jgi:hypothetical protein
MKQCFDASAESSPELYLARDGPFGKPACNAGVENEFVGKFDRLAHVLR